MNSHIEQSRRIVGAVSYLLFFITGIVILIVEKEDKFVRFHAMQSTLLFGLFFVGSFIITYILTPLDFLATFVNTILWIVMIYVWIYSMVKAYKGIIFKWPIVGSLAEKKVK